MSIDSLSLEKTLHQEIPITIAMGIKVKAVNKSSVVLFAPLEKNINHKLTAFGGSLYSVAVLCGWSLLHVKLQTFSCHMGLPVHIVVHEGNIKYLLPVSSDIEASTSIDSEQKFQRFITMFNKRGIARIQLQVTIKQAGEVAAEFVGNYVIHR